MALTPKQKQIFDFISSYFDKHGLAPTQKEIKDHFKLKSFGSVQRYLKYLMDMGYLESDWNARRGLKIKKELELKQRASHHVEEEIPLLGLVAAGAPIEALENPDNFIRVPPELLKKSGTHFALTVQGNSMIEDGILDGDTIICRQTQNAEQGSTVIAMVDGEATVKNYYRHKDHIELRPANSKMRPIRVSDDQDFKIVGVLAGLVRGY